MSPQVSADLVLDASQAESAINAVGDQLDALFGGTQSIDIPITIDTAAAEAQISALTDAPPVDVPVSADTTAAVGAIDALPSDVAPIDVPVNVDTADAQAQLDGLSSSSTDLGGSLDSTSGSAGSASDALQNTGAVAEDTGGKAAGAGLAIAGVGLGFADVASISINASTALDRFNQTFGFAVVEMNQSNIPGITGSFTDLGETVGITGSEIQNTLINAFQRQQSVWGQTGDAARNYSKDILDLGLNVHALHPGLGDLETVTNTLNNALFTGGRRLDNLGIHISDAAVNEQVMANQAAGLNENLDPKQVRALARLQIAMFETGGAIKQHLTDESGTAQTQVDKLHASWDKFVTNTIAPVVIPLLDGLTEHLPQIGAAFQKYFEIASTEIRGLISLIGAVGAPIGDFVSNVVSRFADMGRGIAQGFTNVQGAVTSAIGGIGQALGNVGNFFQGFVTTVSSVFGSVVGFVAGIPARIAGALSSLGPILGGIGSAAAGAFNGAISAIQGAVGIVAGVVGSVIGAAQSAIGALAGAGSAAGSAFASAISAIQGAVGVVAGAIGSIIGAAQGAVGGLAAAGAAAGSAFVSAIVGAISGAAGAVAGAVGRVVGAAKDAVSSAVGGIIGSIPGLAGGGHVTPAAAGAAGGGPFLVGEQGVELFVPDVPGTVVPNGQFGAVDASSLESAAARLNAAAASVSDAGGMRIVIVRDWAEAVEQMPALGRADPSFVRGRR